MDGVGRDGAGADGARAMDGAGVVERVPPTGTAERVPAPRSAASAAQGISTRMVQLIARHTGRGPTQARTTLSTNLIIVLFRDVMTKAEKTLAAAGENTDVRATRRIFQEMISDEACETVQACTGRTVADVDPANDTAVHVFVLEDIPETATSTSPVSRPSSDRK
jgi:uncharacterized protein YbcI